MSEEFFDRVCPICRRDVAFSKEQVTTGTEKKEYPFIGVTHIFELKLLQCPYCTALFEIERVLTQVLKDGKPVPMTTI